MQDHLTKDRGAAFEIYEFANFRLDVREHFLERIADGTRVSLPDKAFDTLCVLVRNAGRLVEKEELLNLVWADAFVEENNLNKSIHAVRRALGEGEGEQKFIETVKKHGFRFVAEVRTVSAKPGGGDSPSKAGRTSQGASVHEFPHLVSPRTNPQPVVVSGIEEPEELAGPGAPVGDASRTISEAPVSLLARSSSFYPALAAALIVAAAIAGGLLYRYAPVTNDATAPRLAVLPLKPLDPSDNYLGLGMADAIIRRISQTGTLTVRPTSAVRRYLNEDTDALTAAQQLQVDVVLEGTVQRADDRLRVSVNLLRASDGRSLWADNFDMRSSDVFAIQDKVGQQVAASLRLRLDPQQRERFATHYTPSPIAYEYYLKGVYSLDQRGFNIESKPQHEATIALFKKSVEADPNFALGHAQLAAAYGWMAVYIDENSQTDWVALAKEEIGRADALDPQLAETHLARHHVLLSAHEGFQTVPAARELILAQQLNPNVGGLELAVAYNHLGLDDMFDREAARTLEIDPTSEFSKRIIGYQYLYARRYDDWLKHRQKYFDGKPNVAYLLGTGRLEEAQTEIEQGRVTETDFEGHVAAKALLAALRGDHREAEAAIPGLIAELPYKNNSYHHGTYRIACIYAVVGNTRESVKWLRETAVTGFPSYTMFERDRFLDPIRQTPDFVQFMKEMRPQYEMARQEFAE